MFFAVLSDCSLKTFTFHVVLYHVNTGNFYDCDIETMELFYAWQFLFERLRVPVWICCRSVSDVLRVVTRDVAGVCVKCCWL